MGKRLIVRIEIVENGILLQLFSNDGIGELPTMYVFTDCENCTSWIDEWLHANMPEHPQ